MLVGRGRGDGEFWSFGADANAAGYRVLPVEEAEGAHFLAGVEEDFLAVDLHDGDEVIELIGGEVIGIEDGVVAGDDLHGIDLQAGRAGQSDEELRDLVVGAAFLVPNVFSVLDGFDLFFLRSASDFWRVKRVFSRFMTAS